MNGYARYETKPLSQPDEPGLRTGDVHSNKGNTAIGHDIRQQYRYYRQIIRQQSREHSAAQIIRALSLLVLSMGIVAALLISLNVLLPQPQPVPAATLPQIASPSPPEPAATPTSAPPTPRPSEPLHENQPAEQTDHQRTTLQSSSSSDFASDRYKSNRLSLTQGGGFFVAFN